LDDLVPQQPCRKEPFIRNAIGRDTSVHEPIVRRPAHPRRRLVGVLVTGRVAAKPQAQLALIAQYGADSCIRVHLGNAPLQLRTPNIYIYRITMPNPKDQVSYLINALQSKPAA
jgi:hypothetical protein